MLVMLLMLLLLSVSKVLWAIPTPFPGGRKKDTGMGACGTVSSYVRISPAY